MSGLNITLPPPPEPQQCWGCGCTDESACADPHTGKPCHWVKEEFCSVCALLYGDLILRTGQSLRDAGVLDEGRILAA